ncbi:MAG: dTDP-4-dehydrorhamnose 3,5-epimerase family protein [Acidobacteriota bacterium]
MIEGVKVKNLKIIPDERGRLMEILRCDDQLFLKFGQVYVTTAYHGVVKAWHKHKKQTDNFTVIKGMVKFVLFDARPDSKTNGHINEFYVGEYNPILIQIPAGVYHGFKAVSEEEVIAMNIPTEPYDYKDPDEQRLEPHSDEIPYNWQRKDR